MKITTKFNLKDRVYIKELEINGKITAIFVDSGGLAYRVAFFDKAERREFYFEEEEIEQFREKTGKGFNV